MAGCGNCHQCGEGLRTVLDGEEWCEKCQTYRRYHSHGWGGSGENSPCLFVTKMVVNYRTRENS